MLKLKNFLVIFLLFILLSSCKSQRPAPIRSPKASIAKNTVDKIEYKENIVIEDIDDIILEKSSINYKNKNTRSHNQICIAKYEVMEGETIESIASYYGITTEELIYANNLTEGESLQSLQILCIPRKNNIASNIKTTESRDNLANTDNMLNENYGSQEINQDNIEDTSSLTTKILTKAPPQKAIFIWPVTGNVIVKFGDYIKNTKNNGINIGAKLHTKIVASCSGKVIFSGYDKYFGNLVIIENSEKALSTAYAHLESITVKKGDYVNQAKLIGYVGNSGNVTTHQLHFAIKKGSETINPLSLLN